MKRNSLTLYQKFVMMIICIGLIPMAVLASLGVNKIFNVYEESVKSNYENTINNVSYSIESILDFYNNISKTVYYYNDGDASQIQSKYEYTKILNELIEGSGISSENLEDVRRQSVVLLLQSLQDMDQNIRSIQFSAEDEMGRDMFYAYSRYNTYFQMDKLDEFKRIVNLKNLDKTDRSLRLIPTHSNDYFYGENRQVFTIIRNYFDVSKSIDKNTYIGSAFFDIDLSKLSEICSKLQFGGNYSLYIYNEEGDCFYSNQSDFIGKNIYRNGVGPQVDEVSNAEYISYSKENGYGISLTVIMDRREIFSHLHNMQTGMYLAILATLFALILASSIFSKRLTRPIYNMMDQMKRIECGDFKIELPVETKDEIGILSMRFNQMSRALENYIDQSYIAKIKQNEAEMTTLKSQIYPHFLYNTLEIIRMTALNEGNTQVSDMIEALSSQIHYIIGPIYDMVPLEKEIEIIKKYVYLINCRNTGTLKFVVNLRGVADLMVPKLILQPIIENAYIHGIKPKGGSGSVMLEVERDLNYLEIVLMDNGVGMEEDKLFALRGFLDGDEIGIKEEYNWQSIGLKNVHNRIQHLYGERYGLRITSTPFTGTMVRIQLPVNGMYKEERENIDEVL